MKTLSSVIKNGACPAGIGLRAEHYSFLEKNVPKSIQWFEALTENYMDSWGRPREMLQMVSEHFPVALHGVSLSLLNPKGLCSTYLKSLKQLIDEINPFIVSDHLCWTGNAHGNIHDLLPFPLTKEALSVGLRNLEQVQEFLKRPLVIENPSTYMTFRNNEFEEWEFMVQLAKRSGAKILLDINNIFVSSENNKFSPYVYLDSIPSELVAQIHLAGFTDMGDFLFDTHSKPVYPQVFELFDYYIQKNSAIPFMVEWDDDIPEFSVVEQEVKKAITIWNKYHRSSHKQRVSPSIEPEVRI